MSTQNYITAYLTYDETHKICVFTEKMTLLAHATLTKHDGDFLEVNTAVARPGMGTLLYQHLAKYASAKECWLMPDRSGDTRTPSLAKWEQFYQDLNDRLVTKLPEHLNEEIIELLGDEDDEVQCLLNGYKLPADPAFLDGLKHISEFSSPGFILKHLSEAEEWFSNAYEQDSNAFIDEQYPYPKDDLKPCFPQQLTLKANDISIDAESLVALLDDIKQKLYSRTEGNITAIIDITGRIIIDEGHHRFIEKLLMQQNDIVVTLIADERLSGREYDTLRPNVNNLFALDPVAPYCGLEKLVDEAMLRTIATQYRQDKEGSINSVNKASRDNVAHDRAEPQRLSDTPEGRSSSSMAPRK